MTTTSYSPTSSLSTTAQPRITSEFSRSANAVADLLRITAKDLSELHGVEIPRQLRDAISRFSGLAATGSPSAAALQLQRAYEQVSRMANDAGVRDDLGASGADKFTDRLQLVAQALGITGDPARAGTRVDFRRNAEELVRISRGGQPSLYSTIDYEALREIQREVAKNQGGGTTNPSNPSVNVGNYRGQYQETVGRSGLTANEQLLLGQQYGLPIDYGMNPNGAAAQALFMKFVAKHTNDPAAYNLTVGGSPFTHADLTRRPLDSFNADEYHAVRVAFIDRAKSNGVDNAWFTLKENGREVPNEAMFTYLDKVANGKVTATNNSPEAIAEQAAMRAAINYFRLAATVEANRINQGNTVVAGSTPTPAPTNAPVYNV